METIQENSQWYVERAPSIVIRRVVLYLMNQSMRPSLFDHLGTGFGPRPTSIVQQNRAPCM
jgi:hypothetical protein